MSKKHGHQLVYFLSLLTGGALLCFPRGVEATATAFTLPALLCGTFSLSLGHLLIKLGPLPASLRILPVLPAALAPFGILLLVPGPLPVLFLLTPFALLLLQNAPRLHPLPKPLQIIEFFCILTIGAATLFQQAMDIPPQTPPRMPPHSFLWFSILVIIPLGLSTRGILRPLAKTLIRYQVLTLLTVLALYPLLRAAATSFKVPGEPAFFFNEFHPRPRFYRLPNVGSDDLLSSDLRKHPQHLLILRILDEMTWRLSDAVMETTVSVEAPLSSGDMIRTMKLYGYLLEDRHGSLIHGESFTRAPPEEMKEEILPWFHGVLNRAVADPVELAGQLDISPSKSRAVLQDMQQMNLTAPVPGPVERFRLTPQARHPLENGLYPRQILLFSEPATGENPEEIETWSYAPRWDLPYQHVRRELEKLVDLQAVITRRVWRWNQHLPLFTDARLWRRTACWTLAFLLALLAGNRLPAAPSSLFISSAVLSGLLLLVQFPLPHLPLWNLRIALGLWLLRSLHPDRPEIHTRLNLFATTVFFASLSVHTLPADTPLVHQTSWFLFCTPLAVLTLFLTVRPLPDSQGPVRGK